MTRHIWRAADTGVMLWEPATEATTTTALQEPHDLLEADIRASSASRSDDDDNGKQELVLPSIEGFFGPYIKNKPKEDIDWTTPSATSGYASGSTLPQSSPCPSFTDRPVTTRLLNPETMSYPFGADSTPPRPRVRRTLDFGMVTLSNTNNVVPQRTELSNLGSLAALRKLERDPPHQWDEDERELLTIIYRWYYATDVTTLPKVFNAITGLDLKPSVVQNQFERHIILYGGCAYPEFARVMEVPFHDPEQKYNDIHAIIRETAYKCGLELLRRKFEVRYKSGLAKYARSPATRRYWKSLVKRAQERQKEQAQVYWAAAGRDLPLRVLSPGGMALVNDPRREEDENWSDTDDQNAPQVSPAELPRAYSIGFRAYDDSSYTSFSEEKGFTSSSFHCWPQDKRLPPPLSPNGEMKPYLMLHTNNHMSITGGTSPYITVCTSLLQTLVKASNMQNPRIAVVALDHPLLQEPNKVLHAAKVLRMLKLEGLAKWARYKGHAERITWGSIPKAAIISHLPISDLQHLANSDSISANLLALEVFQQGCTTRHVSTKLRNNNVVLKRSIARRIAAVARTFHMDDTNVSTVHIRDFVACFVDGWHINQTPLDGTNASNRIAAAFATTLASRAHSDRDIMKAFQDGIQNAAESIAYYSRLRSSIRHLRAR